MNGWLLREVLLVHVWAHSSLIRINGILAWGYLLVLFLGIVVDILMFSFPLCFLFFRSCFVSISFDNFETTLIFVCCGLYKSLLCFLFFWFCGCFCWWFWIHTLSFYVAGCTKMYIIEVMVVHEFSPSIWMLLWYVSSHLRDTKGIFLCFADMKRYMLSRLGRLLVGFSCII